MDDIVKEFLIESAENLDRLDSTLVELEKSPNNHELLADIFRNIHSIKGTTSFLGFPRLEAVAHAGENLLSKLRDGVLLLNPQITSALLTMVDVIREMLDHIDQNRNDGENDYLPLIAKIQKLQEAEVIPPSFAGGPVGESTQEKEHESSAITGIAATAPDSALGGMFATARIVPAPLEDPKTEHKPRLGELLSQSGAVDEAALQSALEKQAKGDTRKLGEILIDAGAAKPGDVLDALITQGQNKDQSGDRTIRVGVNLLERLMDLVGELVLTRNQIVQYASVQRDSNFLAVSQRLNLVTSDMREIIMKTRMQPMQNVMGKFPRMVRDLALSCEKLVRVELQGQDTELDRTLLEAIKDPLTHLVRNAVDHGIERPEARTAAGKSQEGCLILRAYHEGGQVNIEVSDDGAGLNNQRLLRKAVEKGLISQAQADRMKPHEIANLIFHAGFSTAEKITNVSGRGVGMDVVKTNIERVGGTVDVQSVLGKGTTLRMKIPLTLAIIPVLIVRTANRRFAIPQVSLLELLRLEAEKAERAIEFVHGAPVYRLRGSLLPLLFLDKELQLDGTGQVSTTATPEQSNKTLNIVVLQVEGNQFGLVVDAINDAEEIVVKPLGQHLKNITAFAGATVMGDGEVALILDVMGLAQGGHLLSEPRKAASKEVVEETAAVVDDQKQEFLLFRTANRRRTAVPLAIVDRLEEFKPEQFEMAGGQVVVQYRGELLPIANMSDVLNLVTDNAANPVSKALVCTHRGRRIGIVVDQILDVAEEAVELESRWKDQHSSGSAVVQKHVTDFLDLEAILGRTLVETDAMPEEAVTL